MDEIGQVSWGAGGSRLVCDRCDFIQRLFNGNNLLGSSGLGAVPSAILVSCVCLLTFKIPRYFPLPVETRCRRRLAT